MVKYGKTVWFMTVVIIFVGLFNFIDNVFAQEKIEDELLKKGVYLFRQESYDEALSIFHRVRQEDKSSLVEYYMGLTYKRLEDYVSARKHFEISLSMQPKIKGALIEHVDLLYRLGDFEEAKKWIAVAEREGVRPAQSRFLKGLTLQKTGEHKKAIKAFKDAKDLDDRLTQSADYQVGLCHLKLKNYGDARAVFKEIFAMDPYSEVGEYANRYLNAIDRKLQKGKPFHVTAKIAFEYDSNVILKPTDSSLTSNIQNQDDFRQTIALKGDYTFRTDDNLKSIKVGYGINYSKQTDFEQYDVVGNNLSLQGNLSFDKILVTFPLNYNHTVINTDKNYLSSFSAGNVNNFMLGKSQMVQAGAIYTHNNYLGSTALTAENRSGSNGTLTTGWFWFFKGNKGFVNLRYNLNKDWTEGENWEYIGNRISAGILYPFFDKFKLSVNGEVFLQNFDNTHSVFGKKREDQIYTVVPMLSYEFFENMEIQTKYAYISDQSNISIYEYDRYIVSMGVQYKF